jgi:hypothetical protein
VVQIPLIVFSKRRDHDHHSILSISHNSSPCPHLINLNYHPLLPLSSPTPSQSKRQLALSAFCSSSSALVFLSV